MRRPIMDERLERALSVARRAAVVAALAAAVSGAAYLGVIRPQQVIDRLAARARPDRALPGPVIPPAAAGIELALRDPYRFAPANEDASVSAADRMAVINRWTREIYPHFGAFMLACVLDPARRLKTPEQAIDWIRGNVSYGPVFEDHAERIMTADQVIVYRKGTLKDQALLFAAVRELNGHRSLLSITRDGAYVLSEGVIYDAKTWRPVERIEGEIEIRLSVSGLSWAWRDR